MPFVVVDGDVDVIPRVGRDFPVCGQERVEVENRVVHFVAEITTSVFDPFLLDVSRCDRDLVFDGTDEGLKIDPIGVTRDVVVRESDGIVDCCHSVPRLEAVFPAHIVVPELAVRVVTQARHESRVDKRAV